MSPSSLVPELFITTLKPIASDGMDGRGGEAVRIERVVTEGRWDRPDQGIPSGSRSG
jgi:hypothetical protein